MTFRLEVELGSMPYTFMRDVGETARRTLRQGLHGCEVIDCVVTLTHTGYWARQSHAHGSFDKSRSSTAGDFRGLTPLVLMDALKPACTSRCTASTWRSSPACSARCCRCCRGSAPSRRARRRTATRTGSRGRCRRRGRSNPPIGGRTGGGCALTCAS
ncbi:hypothetical protein AB0J42_36930 [Nonomuraea sp. NPDC049649]|uniref:hypothetical protein n=1 Tax=Nonomuraea sp. NPDC049649 TaxID=3155776 RepID=UPI0034499904